jgi:hypothetical protein
MVNGRLREPLPRNGLDLDHVARATSAALKTVERWTWRRYLAVMGLEPPSRADVERQFERLLAGTAGRDEVDRWAGRYFAQDVDVVDPVVWTALDRLHGIDLRDGPGGEYLHGLDQVAEWLAELESGESVRPRGVVGE